MDQGSDCMIRRILAGGVVALMLMASAAYAVTSTFSVAATWADPFSIVETQAPTFGTVVAGVAGRYALSVFDTAAALDPGGAIIGGVPKSGNYLLTDSSNGSSVDIHLLNPVPDNGVNFLLVSCRYNAGATVNGCSYTGVANPGAGGKTLLLGMRIFVDGTQNDGETANLGFDLQVTYN